MAYHNKSLFLNHTGFRAGQVNFLHPVITPRVRSSSKVPTAGEECWKIAWDASKELS